jgi:hypothetical protein
MIGCVRLSPSNLKKLPHLRPESEGMALSGSLHKSLFAVHDWPVRFRSDNKPKGIHVMNKQSRIVLYCLLLVSFSVWAGPFPETAQSGGLRYYRTGNPVPAQYLAENNVIQNYHHYHLDKPTDGYEWVHGVDNDYLLVSTKSGILRRIEYRLNIPRDPAEAKQ